MIYIIVWLFIILHAQWQFIYIAVNNNIWKNIFMNIYFFQSIIQL